MNEWIQYTKITHDFIDGRTKEKDHTKFKGNISGVD